MIAIVEEEGEHGELEMVQANTFVPVASPVMAEVGEVELEITPVPETNVQTPLPTVGVLPAISVVGVEIHKVWSGPATDVVGSLLTLIVTLELDDAHGEFEIVHTITLLPVAKLVTVVVGELGVVIVPDPEAMVQIPVPTVGVFPPITALGEEIQTV
jgi:hypothetical protein